MNYDSAGLMAQIQALIAAPTSSRSRTNNNKHPYFKRPGRGHNHDTCDACHEAGDLLCCDTCSASFHLMCVNPPLDYEQIPAGDWRCHRCLSTQGDSNGEGDASKKLPPVNRRSGKKRAAAPPSKEPPSKKPTLCTKPSKCITAKGGKVVSDFFTQAVELARKMNPEQFVLPKYLMEYGASQFPGAPRPPAKKGASKANKQIIETENGMVPSPVINCFVCDISCRRSPMIRCDACSASFHFDCLTPPLTGVPQGRWLCHLHPEPILEHKKLKSLSFTERVRLYDYAKQPIDPVQVALKFVTKTQRAKYSYFRSKVKIRGKEFTQIPGPIIDCYANDSDDPELPEWPSLNQLPVYNTWSNLQTGDTGGNDEWNRAKQMSPLDLLAHIATTELNTRGVDLNVEKGDSVLVPPSTETASNTRDGDGHFKTHKSTNTTSFPREVVNSKTNLESDRGLEAALKAKYKFLDGGILDGLDLDTVLHLAAQKAHELRCNETIESVSKENNPLSDNNQDGISTHTKRNQLYENGVCNKNNGVFQDHLLSYKRMSNDLADNFDAKLATSKDTKVEISVPYIKLLIVNQQKELTFREGEIMIGRGHVELDLTEFAGCTSVTDEHCCIYYDYVGSRWELINYSPNGTYVNKVLYGCEPTAKNSKNISFMDNLRGSKPNHFGLKHPDIHSQELEVKNGCHCRLNGRFHQQRESLEMSAYLEVGSRIQVGCIRIVVVDSGCESKWVPKTWLVCNGMSQIIKKEIVNESDGGNKPEAPPDTISRSEDERDDSESSDIADEAAPMKASRERRKSFTKTISTRGGARGRGRGRGRGGTSFTSRKRSESVQQTTMKELHTATARKVTSRGRRRKLTSSSELSVVVQTNGKSTSTSPVKEEDFSAEMDDAAATSGHDYGVPNNNSCNRKSQLPISTNDEIKEELCSGDELARSKSPVMMD